MRVICINEDWRPSDDVKDLDHPYTGGEYDVVEEGVFHGVAYFTLAGFQPNHGFAQINFATLPDQTADQMQEQEKEAILM